MKNLVLGITFLLATKIFYSNAQTIQKATPVPAGLKKYIPKGYEVLDITTGDLNLDAYPDVTVVLYKIGEEKTSDVVQRPEKRPLMLFLGQPDKTFKLAATSDNAVYCINCGGTMGDPFTGITIKKGYFSVEHYGGSAERWTRIITFKYSPADKKWYLHKDGTERFYATEPDKGTTVIRTSKDFGKVLFANFDIYNSK